MMTSLFLPFMFWNLPLITSGFFILISPQEMLIYQRKIPPPLHQHIGTTCQTHLQPYNRLVADILTFISD